QFLRIRGRSLFRFVAEIIEEKRLVMKNKQVITDDKKSRRGRMLRGHLCFYKYVNPEDSFHLL
ncbi:MAG: hypothetical protein LBT29_06810, partial [Flavobacteriaceae bacterium]|nr:hypothetical protein [Flavobacteriaceae bacterium]